jgi:NTP pyrophosphatase (non-canonical NTP hydrolase)
MDILGTRAELSNFLPEGILTCMPTKELTVREFQKYIAKRYAKYDRKRGRTDRQNLREEFADVLAWLCTLANINDVDLADAVKMKYLTPKRPKGHK